MHTKNKHNYTTHLVQSLKTAEHVMAPCSYTKLNSTQQRIAEAGV